MRGLYRYLSPFTPDQSGAASVLFELGGLIIICDAGGCAGNVCGFDEPRFQSKHSAVFSACLRDMDAIMGRDDKLIAKTGDALASFPEAKFIAYIGTPVPAVIGTDFRALKRMAEKKFHLPVVTCATNGMDSYDKGEEKAYRALIDTFACGDTDDGVFAKNSGRSGGSGPFAGMWGATPLDLAASDSAERLRSCFAADGVPVVTFGMDSTTDELCRCGEAVVNYVVSPAGLSAAEYLKEKFGTEYYIVSPFSSGRWTKEAEYKCHGMVHSGFQQAVAGTDSYIPEPVLIVHQQFMANAVREMIRASYMKEQLSGSPQIDVATFFNFVSAYSEKGDSMLPGEDDFILLVKERGYKTIIADPLLHRALPWFSGRFIPLPHYAVSGQLYAMRTQGEFLASVEKELHI
jgi:hypothetical protein